MRGIHDLGGVRGFGPIRAEDDQRFNEDWERRVFGLNMGTLGVGLYNVDENRFARERMTPKTYLTTSYFEQLLAAVEICLVEAGVVSVEEIDARAAEIRDGRAGGHTREVSPEVEAMVLERLSEGITRQREIADRPRFSPGDVVVARRSNPAGHTRLPAYVQGCRGVVTRVRAAYVFPDTNAENEGERPEAVYAVAFDGEELWGATSDAHAGVLIDLWESYLEPVERAAT